MKSTLIDYTTKVKHKTIYYINVYASGDITMGDSFWYTLSPAGDWVANFNIQTILTNDPAYNKFLHFYYFQRIKTITINAVPTVNLTQPFPLGTSGDTSVYATYFPPIDFSIVANPSTLAFGTHLSTELSYTYYPISSSSITYYQWDLPKFQQAVGSAAFTSTTMPLTDLAFTISQPFWGELSQILAIFDSKIVFTYRLEIEIEFYNPTNLLP